MQVSPQRGRSCPFKSLKQDNRPFQVYSQWVPDKSRMGSSFFLTKTCLCMQKTFIFTRQETQGLSLEVREFSGWASAAIWAREVNCGFLLIIWPVSKTSPLPFHVCQWPMWLFYLSELLPSLLPSTKTLLSELFQSQVFILPIWN